MTASNTAFTVFSGIGVVLSIIPLWWHRNIATCMYMIWTALACLVYFVDSIVWSGNTVNWAPVWCDISIRIQIATAVAWPACILCLIRRLYIIATASTASISLAGGRRETIIDLLITIGIPVLEMGLEYIVAGHRFKIIEDFGCSVGTVITPLAFVLVFSWPLAIGVVSALYGALTIRAFINKRKQHKELIPSSPNLTYDCYWRLMALASVDFCFTIPLTIWALVDDALLGIRPWVSWASIHSGYTQIIEVPRTTLDQSPVAIQGLELYRWSSVLCAFIFFAFFGFAEEARKNYRLLASTIAKSLGYAVFTEGTASSGPHAIDLSLNFAPPTTATQQTVLSKEDSHPFPDHFSTTINWYDLEAQSPSPMEQSTSTSPSSMVSPQAEGLRIIENVPDPALAKASPVPLHC